MQFGLNMECDYLQGKTGQDAFEDVFAQVDLAESVGLDSVWLAERHFASGDRGQPSIASAPIILATAIAAHTSRLRVGTGVYVLPLNHPVRIAEEVATLDYVSQGRFALGVGRSGFTTAYEGYQYDYGESRERLQECLEILVRAWTQERFSYTGKHYQFHEQYDDLLRDWVVYGTPDEVAERLQQLIDELDLSGVILEMNAGGLMPIQHILSSLQLFGEAVAPRFR